MTVAAASLFDRPVQPALGEASDWTQGVLGGTLTTSLCIVAVAILGMLLLSGRLRFRGGVEVVLGCFLLFGAGITATRLQQFAEGSAGASGKDAEQIIIPEATPTPPPPPANYDPYAGASLRRD